MNDNNAGLNDDNHRNYTANIFNVIFTVFKCVPISTVISLYGLHLIAAPSTFEYRIVASTSSSRIEAHAGLFRSLMKGIFDPYVL